MNAGQLDTLKTVISKARIEDILDLMEVFGTYVKNRDTNEILPDEILNICTRIGNSINNEGIYADYEYFVVRTENGKAIGIVGLRSQIDEDMLQFTEGEPTLELINFFVAKDFSRMGFGEKLMKKAIEFAKAKGYKHVIWNSGPRYAERGHRFYFKNFGEPLAVLIEKYGPNGDAPVWRVDLQD